MMRKRIFKRPAFTLTLNYALAYEVSKVTKHVIHLWVGTFALEPFLYILVNMLFFHEFYTLNNMRVTVH